MALKLHPSFWQFKYLTVVFNLVCRFIFKLINWTKGLRYDLSFIFCSILTLYFLIKIFSNKTWNLEYCNVFHLIPSKVGQLFFRSFKEYKFCCSLLLYLIKREREKVFEKVFSCVMSVYLYLTLNNSILKHLFWEAPFCRTRQF